MSKDDYFVIAYRILSYFYQCLKDGLIPSSDYISSDALKINPKYFINIMQSLQDEGYIKGIAFLCFIGAPVEIRFVEPKITQAGIEFLQENKMMKKAVEALALKDIVPGF